LPADDAKAANRRSLIISLSSMTLIEPEAADTGERGMLPTSAWRLPTLLYFGLAAAAGPALAWPERTVTLVTPFAAGGTTDPLVRLTAVRLSKRFGQPFIVEPTPGSAPRISPVSSLRRKQARTSILSAPPAPATSPTCRQPCS
jgi:hypothetical protein